jgi:CDP-glucose 4,6-dehydratase
VGGGDWSEDRLVPDFVRAVLSGQPMTLRYPEATRPWQHVLALVEGYLTLLAALIDTPMRVAKAWNFGPLDPVEYSVRDVVELLAHNWTRPDLRYLDSPLHEMTSLGLDSSQARVELGWKPKWDTPTAIRRTAEWYRAFYANPADAHAITLHQIQECRQID